MTDSPLRAAREIVALIFGPVEGRHFAVRYWDGEVEWGGGSDAPPFTIVIARRGALRRMLLPPSELSIVEAILSGDVDIEGDAEQAIHLGDAVRERVGSPGAMARLVRLLLALPRGAARDDVAAHRAAHVVDGAGSLHEPARDQAAIRYHYDVGNDFYALWLDRAMVYSCAYFESGADPSAELDDAQFAKLELVCRKLRLRPGERLLDVGCGWGALVMHAVRHHGVSALGITLSEAQAELARRRIAEAGLADRCRVEIRDYRALAGEPPFDKVASIGMVEHVGAGKLPAYFNAVYGALKAGGLFLNHGIVSVDAARPAGRWDWLERRLWKRDAFIDQYVFPDGRLTPFASVITAAEAAGFETRDVESLREHYTLTLRAWLTRLMRHRDEAIRLTDERLVRTWRLYMTASAHGFASGHINVLQTLLAKPLDGVSGLPLRRFGALPPGDYR